MLTICQHLIRLVGRLRLKSGSDMRVDVEAS